MFESDNDNVVISPEPKLLFPAKQKYEFDPREELEVSEKGRGGMMEEGKFSKNGESSKMAQMQLGKRKLEEQKELVPMKKKPAKLGSLSFLDSLKEKQVI